MNHRPMGSVLDDVSGAIRAGGPTDDATFDALALDLYRALRLEVPAWDRVSAARGVDPAGVRSWRDIAAVPSDVFRHAALHAASAGPPVRTFASSGTTSDQPVKTLFDPVAMSLMDTAIDTAAERWLFPDGGVGAVRVLGPDPAIAPGRIILRGLERLAETFAGGAASWHVGPRGLDGPGLVATLREDALAGRPVLVAGASFAFVALFDALEAASEAPIRLPAGSRLLHAGGFKNQTRELACAELAGLAEQWWGLPPHRCVNLLGMTELSSQFYEDRLAAACRTESSRAGFCNAPWTRTRVLDPGSLEPVQDGTVGLLCHVDLACGTRPFVVLSTDLGHREGDRFFVLGRAKGADLRGCSLDASLFSS